jgi:hypothetical protein
MRVDFNLQISVPIANHFLQLLNENSPNIVLSYNDIFSSTEPTQKLLDHFQGHFGFDFKLLDWTFDKEKLNIIIEKVFESLISNISKILSNFKCDIILLSGRPTSLEPITNLFLKHFAISPNRLKTMNNYRVGRWYPQDLRYPYVDENGKFINPKSLVVTGAMIGYLAERGGLNGFRLNFDILRKNMISNTNYFGILDSQNLKYLKSILTPNLNNSDVIISSLPARIGVRQYDIELYPSRPFYTIDFNYYKIRDRAKGQIKDDNPPEHEVDLKVIKIIDELKNNFPLTIKLNRDFNENKEKIEIDEVLDKNGKSINKNFIKIHVQSMSEPEKFWLDTGIFNLGLSV